MDGCLISRPQRSSTPPTPTPPCSTTPPWHALTGRTPRFAIGNDLVRRYPETSHPSSPCAPGTIRSVWRRSSSSSVPAPRSACPGTTATSPEGWEVSAQGEGVQLVETDALLPRPDPEAILLGADDVADMLAIVERNQPGPFRPRTLRTRPLRRHPPRGAARSRWPASACTPRAGPRSAPSPSTPSTDGRVSAPAWCSTSPSTSRSAAIARCCTPPRSNVGAIAAYERLGFALRRRNRFAAVRTPA